MEGMDLKILLGVDPSTTTTNQRAGSLPLAMSYVVKCLP
jgi:hypothetical protein